MNAYELADLIALCGDGGYNQDAANMLRQQADRIAQLDKQGKPKAWIREDGVIAFFKQKEIDDQGFKWQLLYLAPQTKPLSDDEIVSIWEKANYESQYYEASDNFAIEFARAIEERHGIK